MERDKRMSLTGDEWNTQKHFTRNKNKNQKKLKQAIPAK